MNERKILFGFQLIFNLETNLQNFNILFLTFVGFENTYATTTEGRGSPIPRTGSPERAGSPIRVSSRGVSPARFEMAAVDVDPEAVRMALRDFVQQLANAERERVSILYV